MATFGPKLHCASIVSLPHVVFWISAKLNKTFILSTQYPYLTFIRKAGVNKLIRILHHDGKYGFSHPLEYSSVTMLIKHFKANSLSHYNSGLDICLTQALPRPLVCLLVHCKISYFFPNMGLYSSIVNVYNYISIFRFLRLT